MQKKYYRAVAVTAAAFFLIILSSLPVFALTFNGNATGGNSGTASVSSSGGYSLPAFVDDQYSAAPAYRFTVIDGSGSVKGASFDIFKAAYTKYAAKNYHKFSSKQPKTVLKNRYTTSSFSTSATNANTKTDTSGIGLNLPAKTTDVKGWCTAANIGQVLNKLWNSSVATLESNGWSVLIEPVYPVRLQNQDHTLTVTEMAVYGAALFGGDTVPPSGNNQNSWAWISNYTNKLYPNALRIATAYVGLPAASELSARASFTSIVTGGYGAALVYGEYTKAYTNSISHWAWGFRNKEGNNGTKEGFRLQDNTGFTATYASSFVMNSTRAVTIPNGFYLKNTFGTSSISGSWNYFNMGTSVKQANNVMSFEYDYLPYSYTITYNLDGGTNHKDNPSTYNVLYGVTLKSPTKTGYTFQGWYIGNTKVTGINAGATASFSSASDLYKKLKSRRTGNVTVKASWKVNAYTNSVSHWATGFKKSEGNNNAKTAFRISGNTGFSANYGSSFLMNASRAVKIPNGFYLNNSFGTSSISGSWKNYNMGTSVKQKNNAMGFEYYYAPYSYKITYNLDGGTNHKDNPSTYNVLYGVTLKAPTKTGYTFQGWYIGNTKVTGINAGATASFSSASDLYSKLSARRIGNVTVKASWKVNAYTNVVSHWAWGFQNKEGNNSSKTAFRLSGDTGFSANYGSSFLMNSSRAVTIPKGFYLDNAFGSSSISGSWKHYNMGTSVKQINNAMSFEYDYKPYSYTITYNLGGGTNHKDNPSTYNVLYGVTFQNPTKAGYSFDGWYSGNTRITGINVGANATFGSYHDLYTKLNARTTGNISVTARWKSVETPEGSLHITALNPNIPYREDTEVVSSFWLINPLESDVVPNSKVTVEFTVNGKNSTKVTEQTKSVVVPKKDKNLVYFKWKMPTGWNNESITANAVIKENGVTVESITKSYATTPFTLYTTPDTKFEKRAPTGFTVPAKPSEELMEAQWWEYVYEDGQFQKKTYAVGTRIQNISLASPTSRSAVLGNVPEIRSGYGFTCSYEAITLGVEGLLTPFAESYSVSQYGLCLFPETGYKVGNGLCRTFQKAGHLWNFCYSAAMEGKQHYTPLYFPDGEYHIRILAQESWTPAGAIHTSVPVTLKINGSLYDDWYESVK